MNDNKLCNKSKHLDVIIKYWPWVILLVILAATALLRIHLLNIPLERDEGEYAYAGQLILKGIAPYTQVYNMKMPGIYAAYALIMAVFGQTHISIHLGLLIVNAVTILLLFLLAKELFGPLAGVTSAAGFALLSAGQWVYGFTANAEHFVIVFALGGILLLRRAVNHQKKLSLLAGALLLGIAFLMKQHGVAFVAFGGLYLFLSQLRRPINWRSLLVSVLLFLVGVLTPFAITCLILKRAGAFEKFWFWTFDYAREYVSAYSSSERLVLLKIRIVVIIASAILFWVLAGFGLLGLLCSKRIRQHSIFVAGFLVFSFIAVSIGFYFRWHYFIFLLPAVALLAGAGTVYLWEFFSKPGWAATAKAVPVLLAISAVFHGAYQERQFFFLASPTEILRMKYGFNPFAESLAIAEYIENHSTSDDEIAILGSEPQILFYAKRHSATAYIYMYPLMEIQPYALQMQQEMITQIESARPKFLIFTGISYSWKMRDDSEKLIYDWFEEYQQKYYKQVGVVEIIPLEESRYIWGPDAQNYSPQSKYYMLIFERRNGT